MRSVYPVLLVATAVCALPSAAGAAGWTRPLRASSAEPTVQVVGLLPNGTAGLATVQTVGDVPHVVAQTRPAGGVWSAPQDLGATSSAAGPPVITTAGNTLILAYDKRSGNDQVALATLTPDAAGWTDLGPVDSGTLPRLAGAPDGSFVLAYRGILGDLVVRRSASATALGPASSVSGAANVTSLDLSRRANGQLVAGWSESETTGTTVTTRVEAARAEPAAAFGPPVSLDTESYSTQGFPPQSTQFGSVRVAATAQDATVAWGTTQFVGLVAGRTEVRRLPVTGAVTDATQTVASDGPPQGLAVLADDAGVTTLAFASGGVGAPSMYAAIRPAGATAFPAATAIAGKDENTQFVLTPALAVSGSEALIAFGYSGGGTTRLVRRVGTTLQPAVALEANSGGSPGVAGDGSGQFVVAYPRSDAGSVGTWSRFYDRTPPVLAAVTATPASVLTGAPVAFGTTATDALSPAPPVSWTFGDGASGEGSAVSHAYATPGQPTATARAVDEAGNEATVSASVAVTAPTGGTPPVVTPPVVTPPIVAPPAKTSKRVAVSALKLTKSGLRLRLSAPARLSVSAQRRTCRTVKRRQRCSYAKAKKASVALKAGTRTVKLGLRRGTYRVTVSAKNDAGTTKKVAVLKR